MRNWTIEEGYNKVFHRGGGGGRNTAKLQTQRFQRNFQLQPNTGIISTSSDLGTTLGDVTIFLLVRGEQSVGGFFACLLAGAIEVWIVRVSAQTGALLPRRSASAGRGPHVALRFARETRRLDRRGEGHSRRVVPVAGEALLFVGACSARGHKASINAVWFVVARQACHIRHCGNLCAFHSFFDLHFRSFVLSSLASNGSIAHSDSNQSLSEFAILKGVPLDLFDDLKLFVWNCPCFHHTRFVFASSRTGTV